MAFVNPTEPNLADFLTYIIDQGVPAADLPPDSAYPDYALNYALEVALGPFGVQGSGLKGYAPPYVMAVYQLGFHHLLMWAPDQVVGALYSLTVTDGGSGYTTAPAVTVAAPASGTTATASAIIQNGAVSALVVVGQGSGYASAPVVTINPPPTGTAATGTASIVTTAQTFFADARVKYELNNFQSGVVLASGDQNTSQTLVVPELYKNLTMYAQDLVKTPWGRAYLQYAQLYGSTIIGLT